VPNINPALCTHIVYAFAVLDTTSFGLTAFDTYLDLDSGLGNLRKFTALRQSNPGVKLLLALGGWTDSQQKVTSYKNLIASSSNQNAFLKYADNYHVTYHLMLQASDYLFCAISRDISALITFLPGCC
jgi:chitinase